MCVVKKYKKILIILIIFFSILVVSIIGVSICNRMLQIEKVQIVSLEEEFTPKYNASFLGKDLSKNVTYHTNIKEHKIGEYIIQYSLKFGPFHIRKKGKVIIKDTEKPEITLKGEEKATVCLNHEYEEEGYQAFDNYDGDITDKVTIDQKKDKITYTVEDSSNNRATITRSITYADTEKPTISLKGNTTITLYQFAKYKEPGYTVKDNCDGDITKNVKINGSVNTSRTGTYTITYIVKDASGNETTKKRTVKVIAKTVTSATIYLTFDDGPSNSITPKILDILKEEGVQATFFVINHSDSLNKYIKRAHDEGHTIALHSYTHNYKKIYASKEAYFEDLYKIQKKVESITGTKQTIIRFPGGSSNTVSRFNPKIMTTLAEEVEKQGFTYFDWNVSSGDAGGAKTKEQVYNNVVSRLKNSNNIVLMHDSEGNYKTLNALRDIIKYGKANGYKFSKITTSTMPNHHHINN